MAWLITSLAQWCPLLEHVSFLPFALSPIVRHVTDSQEMLETAMSFVTNQWAEWFDGYPAKPRTVLDRI
jgi:hypothetical protein